MQVILFSKDLKKQVDVIFLLGQYNEILSQTNFSFGEIEKLRNSPDEQYIFIYNNSDLILDSSNTLDNNHTQYDIKVKGDYYHTLAFKTLGISYNKLTDKSNLVWIDLNNK